MESQTSFAQSEFAAKKKQTRRERFLGEMEAAVPWVRWVALIEPFYPKGERGRPPLGVARMLRVYFLQQWYALADEALEDALYDSQAMRAFVGSDQVPDATTLLKFRRLLEAHALTRQIFAEVNAHLGERGLLLREGTIVDATIIAAAPSTKNKAKARDPEMHQTSRECLALHVARQLTAVDLIKVMEQLVAQRGVPGYIRSDNGSEFVARTLQSWLADRQVKTLYIEPGSPLAERARGKLPRLGA